MPRYRLTGVHRPSGRRIKPTVVEAADPADARRRAERAGVAVAAVEPLAADPRPLAPADPTDCFRPLGRSPGGSPYRAST